MWPRKPACCPWRRSSRKARSRGFLVTTTDRSPSVHAEEIPPSTILGQPEWVIVGSVVGLALVLRVWALGRIPGNLMPDEADNLQFIISIFEAGRPGLFGLDWKPAPAFSIHLESWFMRVVGQTVFGFRLSSALLSALALFPCYALARRVVRPPAAIAAAVLLATSLWYLHFSRSGWENVHTALYALLAAWAVTVGLERGHYRWFVVGGVAAALGLYGYFSGRLILPALLAYAPLALWWSPGRRRFVLAGFAILTATAIVLFLPEVPIILTSWTEFNSRVEHVNVWNQPLPFHGETSDLGILGVQVRRFVAGFILLDGSAFNGSNGRYGPLDRSVYDLPTALLFFAGLIVSLRRFRATAHWWLLLWIPLLATQIPSNLSPDAARAVMVAPFVYLFVAVAIDRALGLVPRRLMRPALGILASGVLLLAASNARDYVVWIQSPAALQTRQPAVDVEDFDVWYRLQREVIRNNPGGRGFNTGEWQAMRPRVVAPTASPTPIAPAPR